jgi:surfactin synthase thioesterase subunit
MAAPPPPSPSALARRVNLIEALTEQLDGQCAVSEDAPETMSEQEIREAFSAMMGVSAAPPPVLPPEPDAAAFRAWFPRAAQTAAAGSSSSSSSSPRPVVLAFPPAGCGEDVYTHGGGGGKEGDGGNPLLEWCRAHGADLLAAQPPGRGARLREPAPRDLRAYAEQVAPLVARRIAQAPWWAVAGHSKGSWAAVECLRALGRLLPPSHHRRPLPLRLMVVGAMPPPDWPENQRPWRRQRDLDDAAFRDECRGWDVSPQLLDGDDGAMWRLFEPALRADFRLFDEYEHVQEGQEEGEGRRQEGVRPRRVLAFWGARDRRVTEAMVEAWRAWAAPSSFSVQRVDGHHLWPLEWRQGGGKGTGEDPRVAWLRAIAEALDEEEASAGDGDGGRD